MRIGISRFRRALLLTALLPLLAACENSATAFMVEGKEHALILVREQKVFWTDEVKQAVIASRLPNCQKRVTIHPGVRELVDMQVYEAGDRLWALHQGNRWYLAGTEEWKRYTINGADASFIEHSHAPLSIRATGYDSDAAVWEALRQNPDLAVIDSVALPGPTVQIGSAANFFLQGVQPGDTTMEPIQVEIGDPVSGQTRTVTIIGVINPTVSVLYGLYVNDEAFDQVFAQPTQTMYYVQTQAGTDNVAFAKEIKAKLIAYGVQAESLEKLIEQGTGVARGFLMLVEGFMALGLVVGIAALGVIAFRSVVERRQQIGMFRAIGYSLAMVGASFLIESTMITVLGVGSGTILGLILSRNLMTSDEFTGSSGAAASFLVPWGTIALLCGIALVAALVMAYIPARKAASVPIADALRYE